MSVKQVDELKRKFIFVDYKENFEGYAIDEVAFPFENGKLLIMTKITLSDYSLLFHAIGQKKMKIPVRLLRILKDELYLYTLTNEPTKCMKVASIDDERVSNDELVLSIGTIETVPLNGLKGISTDQWYRNIVMNDLDYSAKDLLTYAPELAKQVSGTLPINSLFEDEFSDIIGIEKLIIHNFDDLISNTIKKNQYKYDETSIFEVKSKGYEIEKEMLAIAHLDEDQINVNDLENYLKHFFNEDNDILRNSVTSFRTHLRRLIRIYDYLKGKQKNL